MPTRKRKSNKQPWHTPGYRILGRALGHLMVQHSQGIINDVQMGAAIIILRDAGIRIKNDITGMRCKCGRKWRDDPWEK